jgi:hypothetical protein
MVIKDDKGQPFASDDERKKYITNFFADIYKEQKPDPPIDYDTCIQEFLGPDIINNPVVLNSKLTVQERDDLDRPLTLQELDDSIKNCNMTSASGGDGFSNKLIRLCWGYLRIPLCYRFVNK